MTDERKPELIIVDALKDKHGRTVKVGYRGADVEIIVTPHSGQDGRIAFDREQRDRFFRAWVDAERQAVTTEAASEGLRGRATAAGRDVVEQAARELIGIPDIL